MRPGGRDVLIELFEREFVEPLESLGSRVAGTFRDLDDPDRFVWFRGFADMEARLRALTDFYSGEVWLKHRAAANATIVDNDDVLLLKPVAGRLLESDSRPRSHDDDDSASSLIVVETFLLPRGTDDEFAAFFARDLEPERRALGAPPFATLTTEHRPNNYPRLPVRESDTVFLAVTRFENTDAHRIDAHARATEPVWRERLVAEIARRTVAPVHVMRLQPTRRSALR